jgi:hypothetical protein
MNDSLNDAMVAAMVPLLAAFLLIGFYDRRLVAKK